MFWDKLFGKKKPQKRRRRRHRSKQSRAAHAHAKALEQFVEEEIVIAAPTATVVSNNPTPKRKKKAAWKPFVRSTAGWIGLWALLTVASVFGRDAWPEDETRLLAMAWEMWRDGTWLLPTLNGIADWNTPPLVLWLIQFIWQGVGVNEMAVRLIPSIFTAMTAVVLVLLARNLWPGRVDIARFAPLTLFGMVFWSLFTNILLVDMAVVFFVVMAMWSLTLAGCKKNPLAWPMLSVALSLGILAGGLPILWYVLPVAMLAPAWTGTDANIQVGRWYGGVLFSTLVAMAVSIFWWWQASGGSEPGMSVWLSGWLLPQAANYFSSAMPWWGYLLFVPIVFLPWSVWPLVWLRLWHIRQEKTNRGMKFVMAWGMPMLALLCFLEPRQPHFLLPLFPAFALAITYLLFDDDLADKHEDGLAVSMSFPVIVIGGLLAILPKLPRIEFLPEWLWQLPPWIGMAIAFIGVILAWTPSQRIPVRMINMTVIGVLAVVGMNLVAGQLFNETMRVDEIAQQLAKAEQDGRAIAVVGEYNGKYHFAGRLQNGIDQLQVSEIISWANNYPDGLLLAANDNWQQQGSLRAPAPILNSNHGGQPVMMWEVGTIGINIPE
ncbi:MAG: glycosyltransferase family 39 protein [Proteobacteria bacterium]|nr:glycosyltransferase family 39 protein [Pseudomonadota bacterium]